MKLNQLTRQTAKHVMVFGPPKSGKTLLVGRLAEHGYNLFWFDLENGRTTLYQLTPTAQGRIETFVIPDTKDFPVAAPTILTLVKGTKVRICNMHGVSSCAICMKNDPLSFSTIEPNALGPKDIIVIDSMTQLSNSIMSHIGRGKPDTWKPEWDDYRNQGAVLDRILSSVQNATYHCIFISHEMGITMEDDKEKLVPVAGTKNFARNTAKYFDEVVYCEVKNHRHAAGSSSLYAMNVVTGSRSNIAIEKDKEPSLLRIFEGDPIGSTETEGQKALAIVAGQVGLSK